MEPNAMHAVSLLCAIVAIGGFAAMIADVRDARRKRDSRMYALGPDRNVREQERR